MAARTSHVPSATVRRSKRVTIEDVAARAGVHAATVSRALSRPDQVAEATRHRVRLVAEEMGFVPNRAARGLITGRTGNVAVIVPDITNPHFATLVRGAERAARERDHQVLLVDTGEHPETELSAVRTLTHDVDGFLVVSSRALHRRLGELQGERAVFVNRPVEGYSSVLMRAGDAVGEALHHLTDGGHQRVAYLDGPRASWAATERRQALRRAAKATGTEVEELRAGDPTFEVAAATADRIAGSGATAVMAFNDQMALGVIAGLASQGVRVPEDISVIGCDDVPMAAMTSPALTTIALPASEAGAAALQLLIDPGPTRTIELGATFVPRGSTRAVSRRRPPAGQRSSASR